MRSLFLILFLALCMNAQSADYVFVDGYGIAFSWGSEELIGVFADGGIEMGFRQTGTDEDDNHRAVFNGSGFNLKLNTQYYAAYPFSYDYYYNRDTADRLHVAYTGQRQKGNASLAHLSTYDYMYAQTMTDETEEATFKFVHYGAILRLQCHVREATTFTSVSLTSSNGKFTTEADMNLMDGTLTPTTQKSVVSLSLDNVKVAAGDYLVVYMMVAPTDLSAGELTAVFSSKSGKYTASHINAPNILPGKVYNLVGNIKSDAVNKSKSRIAAAPAKASSVTNPQALGCDFTIDEAYTPDEEEIEPEPEPEDPDPEPEEPDTPDTPEDPDTPSAMTAITVGSDGKPTYTITGSNATVAYRGIVIKQGKKYIKK